MSRNKQARLRRRASLWREQNGRCCWCGEPMLHWNDLRADPNKMAAHGVKVTKGVTKLKAMPPRLATIEHLRDRFDPMRGTPARNQEKRWALACWQCNTERGKQRQAGRPIRYYGANATRFR